MIKYFVRNYAGPSGSIPGQCGTEDVNRTVQDANRQRVVNIVHKRLTDLYERWHPLPCAVSASAMEGMVIHSQV